MFTTSGDFAIGSNQARSKRGISFSKVFVVIGGGSYQSELDGCLAQGTEPLLWNVIVSLVQIQPILPTSNGRGRQAVIE